MSSLCSQVPCGGGFKEIHKTNTHLRVCFFVPIHSLKQAWLVSGHKKSRQAGFVSFFGGERGIRTLDKLLTYTHFPGVLLKPLGHLSLNGLQKYNFFQIAESLISPAMGSSK
jgi:hypothetical protein